MIFRGLPATHKYFYVLHTEDFPLNQNTCIMETFIYNFHMKGTKEMRQFHVCFHLIHWGWVQCSFIFPLKICSCVGFLSLVTAFSHDDAPEPQLPTSGDLFQPWSRAHPGRLFGLVMLSSGCFSAEQLPCPREVQLWSSSDAARPHSLSTKGKTGGSFWLHSSQS